MTRMTGRTAVVFATCAGLLTVLAGCRFDKPFTWKSTVETEFDVPANDHFVVGAYQFGAPFELGMGTIGGKLTTRVTKAQVGTVPQSLDWTMTWYDPTRTTVLGTYTMTAPLKMRPHGGSSYDLSYVYKPTQFAGFNIGANDYLQMELNPVGGTIGTGWKVGVGYTFKPTF